MTAIKAKLRKNIKAIRQSKGYTQERLAELARIDYKYLQRIEGKYPPNITLETLARLAKCLKVNPSELLK